jgi:hypothetical protein
MSAENKREKLLRYGNHYEDSRNVVFDVKRSWAATFTLQETGELIDVSGSRVRIGSNETVAKKARYVINATRNEVPPFLAGRGVPLIERQRVYDALGLELLPAVVSSVKYDTVLGREMSQFTGKQMVKGSVGFDQESIREKKIFHMTQHSANLTNTATLVATNTRFLASSIASAYVMR